MNSKTTLKSLSAKKLHDNNQEYKIHTGWKQEWVSPKHLNGTRPIKVREVVRGPFYSPKLIKISPFVNFISYRDENDRTTRYKKNTYGGIPDPWTECLAIKGYCNEKQAGTLRKSCVSRCMRFWITKRVWKEMGLPLIQGIPDPGRDNSDHEKTYKRSSVKFQKRDSFDPLPHSKSLPDSLEKHFSQKSLTSSNRVQGTGSDDKNRNNGDRLSVEGSKSSWKQPKLSSVEKKMLENNKNQDEHRWSNQNNNSQSRKSGGGGGGNKDSSSNKRNNKKNHSFNSNQLKAIKPSEKTDRGYSFPSLDTATQTSVHRYQCVPCHDSSFQMMLKMVKESILPRKTYKALKEKWIRAKDSYIIDNKNRYFSSLKPCRCKHSNNFPMAIEKEKFDGYPMNNYCARCKTYILQNGTFDCRCNEPIYDRWMDTVPEDEKKMKWRMNDQISKKYLENATTQTELEKVKELKLICSRCNYPYLKTEAKNESNEPTMDYSFDRKSHSIVKNTNDEANHRSQGKIIKNKSTSTSKRNDLNFAWDATESGRYKEARDMKNIEADEESKIKRNVKETDADTKKMKKTYDVEHAKEKNPNKRHNFSVERKEFESLKSGTHAGTSELLKFDHLSDHSSVTSDTYLDYLNKSQLISQKSKIANANKSKNVAGFNEQISRKITKKEENSTDRAKFSKKRSRSKTKSKPKRNVTSKSPVERKSKPRSNSGSKPKIKSTVNKSKPNINFKTKNKSTSQHQFLSNSKSRSKSKFKPRPRSKTQSTSRSKSRSKSRSRSEYDSKSKRIQTESEVHKSKSLGNLPIIRKAENSNTNYFDTVGSSNFPANIEQENSTRTESKEVSTSVTGYVFDSGPCITRNYNKREGIYNDTVDSAGSLYSSTRNLYKTVACESKKFPSEITFAESSIVAPKKKNCWLSKSDSYMDSPELEHENRINNLTSTKGNECYLRFCNSRFCSSVQSLSDVSSNIVYIKDSTNK